MNIHNQISFLKALQNFLEKCSLSIDAHKKDHHDDEVGFSPEMLGGFHIQRSVHVICYMNGLKDKNHMIVLSFPDKNPEVGAGQIDGSTIKSINCTYGGSEFNSQIHVAIHSLLKFQLQGFHHPLLAPGTLSVHVYACRKNTHRFLFLKRNWEQKEHVSVFKGCTTNLEPTLY